MKSNDGIFKINKKSLREYCLDKKFTKKKIDALIEVVYRKARFSTCENKRNKEKRENLFKYAGVTLIKS